MRSLFAAMIFSVVWGSVFGQTYVIATVAGNGLPGYTGDGGELLATGAELNSPNGVALDAAGNLYIADTNNCRIRKVSQGGITTVAGYGACGYSGDDGPATRAALFWPYGVAVGPDGSLYIADTGNNVIRKVANGTITTVAGNGYKAGNQGGAYSGDNGPALSAELYYPFGVAVDAAGNLYIADTYNQRVRKVAGGVITTVAGNGTYGSAGDNGPATKAEIVLPTAICVDAAGNLYIPDTNNERLRKVSGGVITTIAGNGTQGESGDGGPALSAELNGPVGAAVDAAGNLYITDSGGERIREVVNGVMATIAGNGPAFPGGGYNGDDIPAGSAWLFAPASLTVDGSGNVYFADTANQRVRILRPYPVSLSAQAVSLTASSGGNSVQVSVAAGVPWGAVSNTSWITILSATTCSGSGVVSFTVTANTGAARTGAITIAGQTFTIEQVGASSATLGLDGSLPQIVSAGGWDTTITLVNLSAESTETMLDFYSDDGTTPLLPFTLPQQPSQGTTLAQAFDQYIGPNASLILDTTGPAAQTSDGSSQLRTNGNVNGFAIFTYTPTGQAAVAPLETRNASSYLLAFDNTGQVSTGLAIANLSDAAANVNVVIRNDAGAQIGAGSVTMPAQGHNSFMLTDSTFGFPATAGVRGTIEFDTPPGGRISVLGLRANTIPNSSGFAVTSLPTLVGGSTGGTLPHFASSDGWQTTVTLVNTSGATETATLNFFGDSGTAVALPLNFPQTNTAATASSVTRDIPAGGSLIIEVQDTGSAIATSGSALLASTGSIGGFAVFRYNPTGQEAVSPLQTVNATSYILPFDNTGNLGTGLAIANVSTQAASVAVTISNDAGVAIGNGLINLPAQGHTSFMLTDTSSGGWAATQGIRGTVEFTGGNCTAPNGPGCVCTGLNGGPPCRNPPVFNIAPLGLRTAAIPGGFAVTSIPVMVR